MHVGVEQNKVGVSPLGNAPLVGHAQQVGGGARRHGQRLGERAAALRKQRAHRAVHGEDAARNCAVLQMRALCVHNYRVAAQIEDALRHPHSGHGVGHQRNPRCALEAVGHLHNRRVQVDAVHYHAHGHIAQ